MNHINYPVSQKNETSGKEPKDFFLRLNEIGNFGKIKIDQFPMRNTYLSDINLLPVSAES